MIKIVASTFSLISRSISSLSYQLAIFPESNSFFVYGVRSASNVNAILGLKSSTDEDELDEELSVEELELVVMVCVGNTTTVGVSVIILSFELFF